MESDDSKWEKPVYWKVLSKNFFCQVCKRAAEKPLYCQSCYDNRDEMR